MALSFSKAAFSLSQNPTACSGALLVDLGSPPQMAMFSPHTCLYSPWLGRWPGFGGSLPSFTWSSILSFWASIQSVAYLARSSDHSRGSSRAALRASLCALRKTFCSAGGQGRELQPRRYVRGYRLLADAERQHGGHRERDRSCWSCHGEMTRLAGLIAPVSPSPPPP